MWAAAASAQPGSEAPAPSIPGLAPLSEVLVLETPPLDLAAAVAAARVENEMIGGPVRFAEAFEVDVSTASHGRWEAGSDGRTAVWRLRVVSDGAVSLNLGFGRYRMPPGGRLRIYTPTGDEVVGPYTEADNEEHGELWTPILSGGDLVIEVAVPVARIGELELRLDAVNRGFRDLTAVPSPSHGSCNVDVACAAADPYRDQVRSVGHFTKRGTFQCSGALLNNVAGDSRMFFLTAAHCVLTSGEAATMVVYWNYQLPACELGTATRRDSQSGAVLLAWSMDSEVALLELDDEPDPAHNVYLAGWDAGSSPPGSAVAIHHPQAHTKSINVENDPLTKSRRFRDVARPDGKYWRVADWELGANEKGSSGSPLFDQNGRIVGALSGGASECGNNQPDWYGGLFGYWTAPDGSETKRLADWLDPDGTGITSIDGMNPNHRPSILRALDDKAVEAPADGESAQALPVDVAPFFRDWDDDALTFAATSSDESVATVSASGSTVSVTPVAAGSATITVTATDTGGSNKEATQTFQVTVGANRSPEPSGTFSEQSLNEGGTAQVDLTNAFTDGDGDTLTFAAASTDTSAATVALSGSMVTVTAVNGPASATIDVTATDAGGSNTKARQRLVVNVLNGAPQPVGSLDNVVFNVGDAAVVVDVASAFQDPENEALSYRFTSSAPRVARVRYTGSRVTLAPVSRGNATVTATAIDLGGSIMTATQPIAVRVKGRRGVTVSEDALTVIEGATATYTVVLDSEPTGDVTVTPSVVSSTKITASPSSLTFDETDWSTAQTVTVTGVQDDDKTHEASVTVRHAVSGGDYGSVTADSVSVRVRDDDAPPIVSVAASSSSESGGSLTFDVTLDLSTTKEVKVDYATSDGSGAAGARAGADYTAASGTLTFSANSTAGQIVVDVTDDDEDEEEEETFQLTLRNPRNSTLDGGGSTLQATGTIEDDDDPRVTASFGSSSYDVTEGRSVNVAVRLDRDPERYVQIFLDTTYYGGADAADYSGIPTSVAFRAGERTLSFPVTATDDGVDDDGEAVVLSFTALPWRVSAGGETTIAFRDDDGSAPGGGGGQPPPSEPEPGPEPEPPPSSRPPAAAFTVEGATCDADLCRALTGEALRFEDTSAGTVRFRRWEFGDGNVSRAAAPVRAWFSPGFYEVTLDVSDGTSPSTARRTFLVEAAEPKGTCVADAETSCLQDSRYMVTVEWRDGAGGSGAGRVVHAGTNDSGMFRFFDSDNWEVLIKVLDGCVANGHVWVYGASTTDLGYAIRVTDTVTGTVREYRNETGSPAAAITDATAFSDGCRQ